MTGAIHYSARCFTNRPEESFSEEFGVDLSAIFLPGARQGLRPARQGIVDQQKIRIGTILSLSISSCKSVALGGTVGANRSSQTFGRIALGGVLILVAWLSGCASHAAKPVAVPDVVFPPPPETARVQYLGSVSSQADLPARQSGFADYILGASPIQVALAKPLCAKLHGSRVYVGDTVLNTVQIFDLATGEAHSLAGDRGTGKIQQPNSLDFDAEGRLYVADRLRQAVLVYNADETFAAALGHPGECRPVAVAVAGDELFVCDRDEHEIEVWNRADGTVLRRFGSQGKEPGQFSIPTAIALDTAGSIYVTDTGNFRVQKLSPTGEHLKTFGGPGRSFGRFAWPKGIAVDMHDRLYVVDSRFANVQLFDDQGRLLMFFGGPGPDAGNLDLPAGLSIVPWPADLPWLRDRLKPGFQPESLAVVVSQQGQGLINFFAIARDPETAP